MIRSAIILSLVLLPTASAHAMFLEDLTIKRTPTVIEQTSTQQETSEEKEMETTLTTGIQPLPTFADDHQLSRAEFAALIVRSQFSETEIWNCFWDIAPSHPPRFDLVYADIATDDPYAKEICTAMKYGVIRIPANGRFDGDRPIIFSEAATMMSRAFGLEPYADADRVSTWYYKHVRALIRLNAVPVSVRAIDHRVTAGITMEMLDRVQNGITDRPSQDQQVLIPLIRPVPTTPSQQSNSSVPLATSPAPSTGSTSSVPTTVRPSSSARSVQASSQHSIDASSSKKSWWDLF